MSEQPDRQGGYEAPQDQGPVFSQGAGYGPHGGSYGPGFVVYPPTTRPRNGMGIAAMVLGIVALVTVVIGIGIPVAAVGLVLGIIAWARAGGRGLPKGQAIAGVILSALVLVGGGALYTVAFHLESACQGQTDSSYDQCIKDHL